MCVSDAYMYVYVHRIHTISSCPQKSEQGVTSPGAEVTGDCKLHVGAENWTWVLERAANALNLCAFSPGLKR